MKKYKIDKSKNIGNVIFVVEGGRPETGGTETAHYYLKGCGREGSFEHAGK